MDKDHEDIVCGGGLVKHTPINPGKTLRSGKVINSLAEAQNPEPKSDSSEPNATNKTMSYVQYQEDRLKTIEEALLNIMQLLKISNEKRNRCEQRKTKIATAKNNTSDSDSDESTQVTQIRLPRGGWLKNPFDDIKFTGKTDSTNPVRFLRKFENIAKHERIRGAEQLHFFGKCLRDQASTWWELQDFDDIKDAKEQFLAFYWGDDQQARFREKLYMGKYKAIAKSRMSDYALNLAKQARTLDPPMSDKELIRCIKRHFDRDIAREIRSTTATTLMDLVYLLEEIQDEKEAMLKTQIGEKKSTQNNSANRRVDSNKSREQKSRYPGEYANYKKSSTEQKALPWHTILKRAEGERVLKTQRWNTRQAIAKMIQKKQTQNPRRNESTGAQNQKKNNCRGEKSES